LSASVTRLEPRRGSFEQALVAFRAACFRACISELHGIDSVDAAALRSRSYLRLGNPQAALAAAPQCGAAHRDRGELALLRAVAASRLGDRELANEAFRDARVYGIASTNASLAAEVEFYLALDAFGAGNLDGARALCQRAFEAEDERPLFARSGGHVPVEHVVARTQVLLGVIDAATGRYRDEVVQIRAALATLDGCQISDVYEQAFAVRNFAILVRDFDLEDDALAIAERTDALAWSGEIARVKFTALEGLGWCSALRGDVVGALRRFRSAAVTASTPPEEILIAVDRTLLARELGHRAMAMEELEHALTLFDGYNWEQAAGDTRLILLPLAQVAASIAPVRAREVLDRYCKLRNAMDAAYAARIEDRVHAEDAYSHGVVLRSEGREAASTDRLQFAFATWESIGYEWRAARAALELAELGAGDVFRLAVARELRRRPESLFATRARLAA